MDFLTSQRRGRALLVLLCLVLSFFGCSDEPPTERSDVSGLAAAEAWLFRAADGKLVVGASAEPPPCGSVLVGTVEAPGTAARTTTRADGYFKLENIPVRQGVLRAVSQDGAVAADVPVTLVSDVTVRLGQPPITREQAIASLRATLERTHDLETLLIMGAQNPFPASVVAAPAMGDAEARPAPGQAITLGAAQQWFFFVDPYSDMLMQHPVIYALVDALSGQVTLHEAATSAPLINGFSFYYRNGDRNLVSPDLVSAPTKPAAEGPRVGTTSQGLSVERAPEGPRPSPRGHLLGCSKSTSYAFIVNGGDEVALANSASAFRDMLIKTRGVAPENIVQFDPLHNALTILSDIPKALAALKAKLTPCDTLWLYVVAHGYKGSAGFNLITDSGNFYKLYQDWEAQAFMAQQIDLSDVRACHLYAVFDTCFSGNWIAPLSAQLAPKTGLEAVVVTSTDTAHGAHISKTLGLGLPQTVFTRYLLDGLADASTSDAPAPLDVGFDLAMSTIRRRSNEDKTLPTYTGLWYSRALSSNPQVWVRPRASGETCEGVTVGGPGVQPPDAGGEPKLAVKLDYALGSYPAGEVIVLDRVTGGRVSEIDEGCDGRHLHAEDMRVGVVIDGASGPHPDLAPSGCGYGRIVSVP